MNKQITRGEWNRYVLKRPEANFLQSPEWGALHETLGSTVVREVVLQDGKVAGGWQGIVKNARRGRYLEVPGGPLLDWSNIGLARKAVNQMKKAAKEHKCVFIRIRPQAIDSEKHQSTLYKLGFKKAPMHLHAEHTSILDLTKTEEDILAGMRQQTRYEVKRADKQGITVSWQSGEAAVDEFYKIQKVTARLQKFVPSSLAFLRAEAQAFGDNIRIYRAEKDGVLLNLALVIFYGKEAVYHEAASTPFSRGLAGAYAVQWQAIRDAKEMGKTRYNFWGIAYSNDPKHRYAGVTTFKRGFGGEDVTYVAAHDLVLHPFRYKANWLIETIRRKKRKL